MTSNFVAFYNPYKKNNNDIEKIQNNYLIHLNNYLNNYMFNVLTSRLFDIQSLMNCLYQFRYVTHLTINHYPYINNFKLFHNLVFLEVLNLDYCDLSKSDFASDDKNICLDQLLSLSINNCELIKLPLCIINSYWIKAIHAENNNISNISNKIVRLPFLHILNLIGNNINVMYLPSIVYSYYIIGLKHEEIDFIKDRKLLIAIEKKDRIIFS